MRDRADGSHKAERTGVGLALVKRIVDSAGGTIKAENREYGGCRFVAELSLIHIFYCPARNSNMLQGVHPKVA